MLKKLPRPLAELLFRRFEAHDHFLDKIEEIKRQDPKNQAPLLFATYNSGIFEFLALRLFLQKRFGDSFELRAALGIPSIFIEGFRKNFWYLLNWLKLSKKPGRTVDAKNKLLAGQAVLINFRKSKFSFRQSRDEKRLEYLQEQIPQLQLAPVVFIWKRVNASVETQTETLGSALWRTIKAPIQIPWYYLLGNPYNPNIVRKLILLMRGYTKSTLRLAEPIKINSLSSIELRKAFYNSVKKEKTVVLGPKHKSLQVVGEEVLAVPDFQEFLKAHARENKISYTKAQNKAEKYLNEVSSGYSYYGIEILDWILEKVFHNIYEGLTFKKEEVEQLREAAKKNPIVLVPNHRSYIDFLVLSFFLYRQQIALPYIAAGINLNYWPVGNLLKMGGAFFIRRSFKDNIIYTEVLKRYMASLLESGNSLEFFIEGTRSRNGKLASPRYGILKMIYKAKIDGLISKDISFVPVSITYDRVSEDNSHKRELEGNKKAKETLFNTISSSIKVLFKRFGKVHVRFAPSIPLKDKLDTFGKNQDRELVQKLAFEICDGINQSTPLTAAGLICSGLMSKPGNSMPQEELENRLKSIVEDLKTMNTPLEPELEEDFESFYKKGLERLLDEKVLERFESKNVSHIRVTQNEKMRGLYYKNTALHAFLMPALSQLSKNEKEKALKLRFFLEFEFFFPKKATYLEQINDLPSKLAFNDYSNLLSDIFESISIALEYLSLNPNLFLTQKEWVERLMKYGKDKISKQNVKRKEAVNTYSFKAFLQMATHRQWLQLHKKDLKKYRPDTTTNIQAALDELKRITF